MTYGTPSGPRTISDRSVGRCVRRRLERVQVRARDRHDAVQPIEAGHGLGHERSDDGRTDLGGLGGGQLIVRVVQQLERLLWVVGHEVDAGAGDLGQVGLRLLERLLAVVDRGDGLPGRVPAERVHGHAQAADDDDQGEDGQGGPPLRLTPRGERRHPPVGWLAVRHQVLDAGDQPLERAARGEPGAARRRGDRRSGRLDVVRERDGRAVRRACQGLGRPDRHERPGPARRRHLGRLEGDRAVAARTVGRHELLVKVLHRRLRVEGEHGVLEPVRTELGDDVGRDEHERITDRDLAPPDVRLELAEDGPIDCKNIEIIGNGKLYP